MFDPVSYLMGKKSSGSGSSDWSTANVTFFCSDAGSGVEYYVNLPTISSTYIRISDIITVYAGGSATVTVLLYKGVCILNTSAFYSMDYSVTPTVTGDIELSQEYNGFVITGDGTITCGGDGGGNH